VIKAGNSGQYGRYVLIDHNDGLYTLYAGIGDLKINEGQTVEAGDIIGDIAKNSDIKDGGCTLSCARAQVGRPSIKLVSPKINHIG
jgi:septal ring factor EnvC (AmiA/AmiB activator)